MESRRKNQQKTSYIVISIQLLAALLLLELVSLVPGASCEELPLDFWVSALRGVGAKDVSTADGCTKKNKDTVLCSAQANTVTNFINPTNSEEQGYRTIGESIANIPDDSTKRYILILSGGTVYREKVLVSKSKPFVTIRSYDPINPAIIVWNDTAATLGKDSKPLGVDGSSTMTVESDYFIAYGVVFRNDAAAAAKKKKAEGEAPALRVLGTKATFYNCTIEGGQGALYDQMGLHYFKSCTIRGTIDFIFGSAKSFYEDCAIVSVNNMEEIMTLPVAPPQLDIHDNPIKVAPGKGGFSFKTCTITGEGQQIFLGRMGTPSIYSYTQIAKEVVPIIYDKGNIFMPSNMTGRRCATFKCYGPGLEKIWHVKLRYAEAIYFLGTDFINGDSWILSIPPTDAETLLSV
ncbi:Pectinesterase QRT1-like precursor [Zea mays]|uniref:Pectinesterase n=1 Tax=Zea mays TaxID=4577 RepID=B4FCM1_MAIZE|nr:Pectinesterase QRT1-like precursor [Zea mays]ACF79864.1 unknown [Zea mays]|eukprot:NP_001131452.1 uncharacterized protein LOC100192787 precursor [Zea mays]